MGGAAEGDALSADKTPARFLAAASVGAWFTKQALWPVRLPRKRGIPSFFAGWLTNELAFHHLAWEAGATAWFVRRGALRRWPGRLGLALVALQWAGLAVVIRRTFATRAAVADALGAGLGEAWSDVEHGTEESEGIRWRQLVVPLPVRHPDVERTRAVTFATVGAQDLQLDVYRRRDQPVGRPVLLHVHGGAWIISNRNEQGLPVMHEVAARGWVGVNADYRLSPWATFPDHLVDVKRAIAWIREHADEIGADPSFIAVTGGSAGGHLAALAALTPNDPRYQPGFTDVDTSVQACIPFYGIYDLADRHGLHGYDDFRMLIERHVMKERYERAPELFHEASPIDQVRPDAPPFFVVHGAADTLAPTAGARAFADALRAVSRQPVVYAELPGTQHAFDVFPSLRTAYVLQGMVRFLDHALAQGRRVSQADALTGGSYAQA